MAGIDLGLQLVVALVQIVVGIVFSMGSIYIALRLFDKFTTGIDEWKEMKKGNKAVGILLAGIIISIALVVESGVTNLTQGVQPNLGPEVLLIVFVIGLLNLLISVLAAVVSVYIAIRVLDWITTDVDEMAELKKGNQAVAIMMFAVLVAVSFVIKGAVTKITDIVNAIEILKLVGA